MKKRPKKLKERARGTEKAVEQAQILSLARHLSRRKRKSSRPHPSIFRHPVFENQPNDIQKRENRFVLMKESKALRIPEPQNDGPKPPGLCQLGRKRLYIHYANRLFSAGKNTSSQK